MKEQDFENKNLFESMSTKYGFNLFLGAGFSTYAKNSENLTLPLGNEIGIKLSEYFNLDYSRYQCSLGNLCRKIKLTQKGELDLILRETYKVKSYDECYNILPSLPIKNIVTLNIDDLIELIYSQSGSIKDISDNHIWGNVEKENTVPFYKLHGSITHSATEELKFTEEETLNLFASDNTLFETVTYKLSCCPTIFWGSSFSDGNTAQLIQSSIFKHNSKMPLWIVLFSKDKNYDFLYETYHDMGFHIITADTKDLLLELSKMSFVSKKTDKKNKYTNYRKMFPNNFICNELKKSAIARPISDFFNGDEPQISDVLSDNLVKTSYYYKSLNIILNKHSTTLITGIPGCGKSTILLQLAFSSDISGRKFWFNNMISSEAIRLCNLLKDDDNVTIFFDNLYNNLEAYKILKEHNIRIVTAERTINYEYVKSTLNIKKENIIDISNLDKTDIQKICDSINRSSAKAIELLNSKSNISLLEIAFLSFHSYSVSSKIKEYIKSVNSFSDANLKISLIELYTLVNYVSYCGVPISMDMLIFYFNCISYNDIYYAIDKLNSIIIEDNCHSNYEISQDYMIMRSKVFAELSIKNIPAEILKKVLNSFLKKVSPSIIYRYDIFKKKAYDADIIAILNKIDGINFYEKLINQNTSPYIKHQYALFLSRKSETDKAWIVIDNAYNQCQGKIFTIANTHAMLLFNKNIKSKCTEKDECKLKEILNRSFDTLDYCTTKDIRVNYHVLIYSRNTIRYIERFGIDSFAKKYINNSINRITNILDSEEFIYKKLQDELYNIKNELIQYQLSI